MQRFSMLIRDAHKVRSQIEQRERTSGIWHDLADGWQGAETRLKLPGWSWDRRCIFVRQPAKPQAASRPELPPPGENIVEQGESIGLMMYDLLPLDGEGLMQNVARYARSLNPLYRGVRKTAKKLR